MSDMSDCRTPPRSIGPELSKKVSSPRTKALVKASACWERLASRPTELSDTSDMSDNFSPSPG
jgi:hypothetical protein